MKILFFKFIVIGLFFANFSVASACNDENDHGKGIVVANEGVVYKDADVVYLTFFVLQQGALPSEVAKTAEEKKQKIGNRF